MSPGEGSGTVGRVMALDLGDRVIGVALSDPTRTLATGLCGLKRTTLPRDLAALAAIVAEHEVTHVLYGLPLRLDGRESLQTRKSAALAAHIARALSLPMEPVDERWSTVAASRALREAGHDSRAQRGVIDQAAATVMLQSWLDVHGRAPASP